jgi:hypothetical protein
MTLALLLAKNDWVSFIVPIVFFIIWALNRLIASSKPAVPPARNPQRRSPTAERPLRPTSAAPQSNEPKSGQAQLNAEIEQFLKRANDKKRQDRSKREMPPAARPPKAPPSTLTETPIDVEPIQAHNSVSESVEKHMARSFSQRTEHLADDIVRADQQMEEHLQQAFSHQVGTLGKSPAGAAKGPLTDEAAIVSRGETSGANAIAAMLRDPTSLKRAFILQEILQRPKNRW